MMNSISSNVQSFPSTTASAEKICKSQEEEEWYIASKNDCLLFDSTCKSVAVSWILGLIEKVS